MSKKNVINKLHVLSYKMYTKFMEKRRIHSNFAKNPGQSPAKNFDYENLWHLGNPTNNLQKPNEITQTIATIIRIITKLHLKIIFNGLFFIKYSYIVLNFVY